jgi:hypothetical protein
VASGAASLLYVVWCWVGMRTLSHSFPASSLPQGRLTAQWGLNMLRPAGKVLISLILSHQYRTKSCICFSHLLMHLVAPVGLDTCYSCRQKLGGPVEQVGTCPANRMQTLLGRAMAPDLHKSKVNTALTWTMDP